jgi:hypothetical protein
MTAEEMGYAFDVSYDKIANFDNPGYEPLEKSTFLTQAQEQIVIDIQRGNAFVESNKRILDVLKTYDDLSTFVAGPYANSFWADLPDGFAVINEVATLTAQSTHFYPGIVFSDVRVKPIDDDYYHLNIKNPYKKPNHEKIWRLDYGEDNSGWKGKLTYVIDSDTVLTSVRVHFYRKPSPIVIPDGDYTTETLDGVALSAHTTAGLDSELNSIIHREIVDRAVKLAYAALQDEKGFQISSLKEQQ